MQNTFIKLILWVLVLCFLAGCVPVILTGVGVGAGAGALMVEDRRSSGMYIEDEGIELKTSRRIGERLGERVHVNVTSFNRNVLLTGEAPDESTRREVEKLAMSIENVQNISNEIIVGPKSSLSSRSNDSLITSKVKARFINNRVFQVNHIKVVTENGVVYLIGLVKHKEGETATRIASTTESVKKVVKVFEYLD
ncbi:MAG: BON domain-containing protein [Nitrosomonas sp.]|uniref:BON domain-containing protein n=1 Tax=Nitrosomonas sp. TaxID=42353 RepID=UPI0025D754CA|nr:BON domain-containing protein [Nitrosomonas sp.]MCC6160932.1 BON domain-containing protein [Nitrosomonas sp.]